MERRITVRVTTDLLRRAKIAAANADVSLQKLVERAIENEVEKVEGVGK